MFVNCDPQNIHKIRTKKCGAIFRQKRHSIAVNTMQQCKEPQATIELCLIWLIQSHDSWTREDIKNASGTTLSDALHSIALLSTQFKTWQI